MPGWSVANATSTAIAKSGWSANALVRLLSVIALEQMHRLATDHARQDAVPSHQPDALADEDHWIPAADLAKAHVTVVVDVRDVEADLVDVADDRQRRTTSCTRHA